ncbi:MAG: DUF4097 family beta strand repeat-containing protein, partial [Bacteroidota bacterium]
GIIFTITFFTTNNTELKDKNQINTSTENKRVNTYNTAKNKEIELVNEQPLNQNQINIESSVRKDLNKDSSEKIEIQNQPTTEDDKKNYNRNLQSNSLIKSIEKVNNPVSKKEKGFWRSFNDTLKVDTLFNGVKALVFTGDKSDIIIQGSERTYISMNYNYKLKAKGVFSKKKEGNCELSYELKDSVLTINVQRKNQKFSGISVLSESSKMEFNVPENVDVKMSSDLGDMEVSGIRNKSTILQTSLGDIIATNILGSIDLETTLGDISMTKVIGQIKATTSNGDISGKEITISDDCKLDSSLGDIDFQLNNPISDCNLNLNTSLGKVKVNRSDLKTKSQKELKTGKGKFKVIMQTSLGKIIVR